MQRAMLSVMYWQCIASESVSISASASTSKDMVSMVAVVAVMTVVSKNSESIAIYDNHIRRLGNIPTFQAPRTLCPWWL